jgi:hypothetical protein
MWSKKWYLKRNISCDADLLNELLETDVPWDDAIVVSAGKLRKMWDSLSELRSSQCERRLERTVLIPALLPVKTAQFTQFFRQVWRHTIKSLSLTLILRRSRTGTVWFYTSTSNKRAARPKLYTKSLTRDLKRMYNRLTLVRISINL